MVYIDIVTDENVAAVAKGMMDASLWADAIPLSNDPENPDSFEAGGLDGHDVEAAAVDAYEAAARAFLLTNSRDCAAFFAAYNPVGGFDVIECLGHDLWLTSVGHGAGFWDRGLGDLGRRLSDACEPLGLEDDLRLFERADGETAGL